MSKRAKQVLGSVATVVVLAGVVFGGWALSAPKHQVAPTISLSPEQQSDQAYQQGLAAMRSGDTTGAVSAFTTAIKLSSNNSAAKTALAKAKQSQADANKSSGSATTKASTPTSSAVDPFVGKKVSITSLVPTGYADFDLGAPTGDSSAMTIVGSRSGAGGGVSHIQWTVYDRGSASSATSFVQKVSKPLFNKNAASVVVHALPASFGTDGVRLAAVFFARGQYVFEVVLTATSPSAAKAQAIQAAEAFASHP